MLFQENGRGLEVADPQKPGEFIEARAAEGVLVLNVGDALEHITNGLFPAAVHRVTLPSPLTEDDSDEPAPLIALPARYSIPFFTAPDEERMVRTLDTCVKDGEVKKYEDRRFEAFRAAGAKNRINYDSEVDEEAAARCLIM